MKNKNNVFKDLKQPEIVFAYVFRTIISELKNMQAQLENIQGNMKKEHPSKGKKKPAKVEKVMKEYKEGKLHSGSKKGPVVGSRKQAVAIALSEARKSGEKVPAKRKK